MAAQEAWLRAYFEREGDYYWIVESLTGIPLGTHGIYNVNGTSAERGRHIMRAEVMAGVPSAILTAELAFGSMGLHELRSWVVATNMEVLSIHRKSGFKEVGRVAAAQMIDGKPVDMVEFLFTAEEWRKRRDRVAAFGPLCRKTGAGVGKNATGQTAALGGNHSKRHLPGFPVGGCEFQTMQ